MLQWWRLEAVNLSKKQAVPLRDIGMKLTISMVWMLMLSINCVSVVFLMLREFDCLYSLLH